MPASRRIRGGRAPPARRGSGTPRPPCSRRRASRDSRARSLADELRRLPLRLREHDVAPGPEVAAGGAAAQARWNVWLCAFTKPGSRSVPATRATLAGGLGHTGSGRRLSCPGPLRGSIPNALTIARFAAIPMFVWLYLEAGDGPAWGAGIFFAAAALTDQLDGYLARRWHVESRFGKVADPLADRLMIGTAAVLMLATGRIPLLAALVILARDVLARPRLPAPRAGRLRARRHLPREGGDLGALRGPRVRARDGGGHDVAARAPVDRHRLSPSGRGTVRATCVASGTPEGTLESSANLEGTQVST